MDDELLKQYHLEGVRKRMQQINEYSFKTGRVEDDDDMQNDPNQMQQPQGGMPPQQPQQPQGGIMGGGDQGQQPQGGGIMGNPQGGTPQQPPMDGGMPPQGGGDMGAAPMGGDMGGQPMGNEMPPAEEPPMGGDMGEMPDNADGDIPDDEIGGEEEEVIDVDDLTQSQEAAEYKIDGVDDKITTVLNVVSKFADAIESNSEQLADLKKEIEKRNPTPEERMNIRSQSSYPYGESPRDYWEKKRAENPNYNVIFDNDVSPENEDKEFEIRRSDLEHIDNKSLSDSLDYPKELRDYINF